jgi:hypothetical protein
MPVGIPPQHPSHKANTNKLGLPRTGWGNYAELRTGRIVRQCLKRLDPRLLVFRRIDVEYESAELPEARSG